MNSIKEWLVSIIFRLSIVITIILVLLRLLGLKIHWAISLFFASPLILAIGIAVWVILMVMFKDE